LASVLKTAKAACHSLYRTAVGISLALKKAHTEEENLENENEIESDNEQEMKL
jgi:Arc/MetJ family transcription regulator